MRNRVFLAAAVLQVRVQAQSCPSLTADYPAPSLASGYEARLVAQGLSKPRGLIFDNNNNLLVIEREIGVTAFKVETTGSCLTLSDKKTIVADDTVRKTHVFTEEERESGADITNSSTMGSSSRKTAKPSTPQAWNPYSNTPTTHPKSPLATTAKSSSKA
jgi:glucose/arabinose dehydrogenase